MRIPPSRVARPNLSTVEFDRNWAVSAAACAAEPVLLPSPDLAACSVAAICFFVTLFPDVLGLPSAPS